MSDYTIVRLEEVTDVLGDYPGEMRMMTGDLESEQVAFTYRRMPQHTGGKGSYGHRHKIQEEVYFVVSGTLQFKLGDEVLDVGAGDGGARRARDLALGVERRARGRGADHRLEVRPRRLGGRRRVHRELLARLTPVGSGFSLTPFLGFRRARANTSTTAGQAEA